MKTKIAILFCIMAVLPGFGQSVSKIIDLRTGEPTEKRVSTRPEIKVEESGTNVGIGTHSKSAQTTTIDEERNPAVRKLKSESDEEEYNEFQFAEFVSNVTGERSIQCYWMDLVNNTWEKVEDNIYDVKLQGAFVIKSDVNPGCESYALVTSGFIPSKEMGQPGLNWEKIGYPNEFDDSYSCEVIGGTYVELPDIDVIPSGRYTPKSTYHMTDGEFEAIKPYSGWWPEMKDMVDKIQYERLILCPYQYNYETRTVRLYSSLRLKFNKKSSVETIDNEDARPVYYTIDGRIEPEPADGKMYIRRNNDRAEKVIYKR